MLGRSLMKKQDAPVANATTPAKSENVRLNLRTPAVTIHESDEAIVLMADMPGVDPASTDITVDQGTLTLRGKVQPDSHEGFQLLHREYQSADFERSFTLPSEVDAGAVQATLRHGVLHVTLPKAKEVQPRRIPVKNG